MPRTQKVVTVPKPQADAFNKERTAGTLLRTQLDYIRQALVKHHAKVESLLAIDLREIRTEAEVAEYTAAVTKLLHPHHGKGVRL